MEKISRGLAAGGGIVVFVTCSNNNIFRGKVKENKIKW